VVGTSLEADALVYVLIISFYITFYNTIDMLWGMTQGMYYSRSNCIQHMTTTCYVVRSRILYIFQIDNYRYDRSF